MTARIDPSSAQHFSAIEIGLECSVFSTVAMRDGGHGTTRRRVYEHWEPLSLTAGVFFAQLSIPGDALASCEDHEHGIVWQVNAGGPRHLRPDAWTSQPIAVQHVHAPATHAHRRTR